MEVEDSSALSLEEKDELQQSIKKIKPTNSTPSGYPCWQQVGNYGLMLDTNSGVVEEDEKGLAQDFKQGVDEDENISISLSLEEKRHICFRAIELVDLGYHEYFVTKFFCAEDYEKDDLGVMTLLSASRLCYSVVMNFQLWSLLLMSQLYPYNVMASPLQCRDFGHSPPRSPIVPLPSYPSYFLHQLKSLAHSDEEKQSSPPNSAACDMQNKPGDNVKVGMETNPIK
ncbi:hypothetical protein J1N35_038716 [Gossypium stocksii]|uniref:Uncharacterized protein n=1 Tax=Gossypium stocksii TaxID=47602 RepID=A0A9D3UMG1_9ROSI|nr:hypothetical protein J1N35_038716 [Gossypium stocksii]